MTGSETVVKIREYEQTMEKHGRRKCPSLMISITGNSTLDDRKKYLKSGFNFCWGKPLPVADDMYRHVTMAYTELHETCAVCDICRLCSHNGNCVDDGDDECRRLSCSSAGEEKDVRDKAINMVYS
eukprot:TRINITY_DN9755_c0_g1_i1.p1 TRINITY_DN9755_c0_g1~~TRINITY_DN9755_c0_g1_i1.p1  ORF type:complete len:139 (+),score=20.83 TRINITY_DN9755_c0_g1_i1:40-417(+)